MLFAAVSNAADNYELKLVILIGWLLIITSYFITYIFSNDLMMFEFLDGFIIVMLIKSRLSADPTWWCIRAIFYHCASPTVY